MRIIKIIIWTIFVLAINSCKKDKLTGDNKVLIGTWTYVNSFCDCCEITFFVDRDLKLDLSEKGKYTLFQDGNEVEHGRLTNVNGFVTFNCRDKKKESDFLNTRKISKFNSDTLYIGLGFCGDGNYDIYIKN
jgi:hypothetical protein